MKLKTGDKVVVIAGKDKTKTGKITKVLKNDKVIVEGINIVKKHMKPNQMNDKGSIIDVEAPIHRSNVKLVKDEAKKETKKDTKKASSKTTASKTTKTTKKSKEKDN